MKNFQASLSRSQGRASWSMIFRHPLRDDREKQPGLRVRRGLGTTDEIEAQAIVDQMNQLLSDPSMWNLAEQAKAARLFDQRVVAAFYDNLVAESNDPWATRNSLLPLPTKDEGYARVLLIGTTGAGKTTVVRQLIGTDPKTERFPSTSASKTTISNLEAIINQESEFKAIVSFFGKDYIRQHLEECVEAAVLAHQGRNSLDDIETKLLQHSEQRFRFNYILGTLKTSKLKTEANDEITDDEVTDDEIFEDDQTDGESTDVQSMMDGQERAEIIEKLKSYLSRIQQIADSAYEDMRRTLGVSDENESDGDLEVLEDLRGEYLETELYKNETFHELVDDMLDDIELRFSYLDKGEIETNNTNWPSYWRYETVNRQEFIETINRFSSNYAANYGRLLTPLVEGIRVSGPLTPEWYTDPDLKLVIMDGEGLGHTPDSASSISTRITERYQSVDAILLIDNAAQPMQAAPAAVLQSLVSSGHHSKLIVGFTHFDEVKGDNLPNLQMRKDHILGSFDNATVAIGKSLNSRAEKVLKDCKNDRIFFLSNVQKHIKPHKRSLSYTEFLKLISAIQKTIEPPIPTEAVPIYDDANLVLSIQKATREFHLPWRARLKLQSNPHIQPEHWTRIKALSRRLGVMGEDEYDSLRPVADLITRLRDHIYIFVENPLRWEPDGVSDEMRETAIVNITQEIDARLHQHVQDRLNLGKRKEWYKAYSYRGRGSTIDRAYDIKHIYDSVAPIPDEIPTMNSRQFLQDMRKLVKDAINNGGGKL